MQLYKISYYTEGVTSVSPVREVETNMTPELWLAEKNKHNSLPVYKIAHAELVRTSFMQRLKNTARRIKDAVRG